MNSEKVQLPDFVIANLFGNNLVIGDDVQHVEKKLIKETNSPEHATIATIIAPPSQILEPAITTAAPAKTAKPAIAQPPVVIAPNKQWYLGNNGKKITILVKETDVAFVNDLHLQFLSNILSACKLNLGDIALINHLNYPLLFSDLQQKVDPHFLIMFDVTTTELQLPFIIPDYQVQAYNQCQFLVAPALSVMDGDSQAAKIEKTKLWTSLKKMFQL